MKITYFLTTTAIALGFSAPAFPQQATQSQPPYCESNEGFEEFDFWVGDWNVTATGSDVIQGTNSIYKEAGGCFLYENWTSNSRGMGKSINYYNPNTGKWRQVWVSIAGYAIDIEGGIMDGSMTLVGSIYYYSTGQTAGFRGTWTPNEDGSVRQFFEQHDSENDVWNTWFDGTYVRQ